MIDYRPGGYGIEIMEWSKMKMIIDRFEGETVVLEYQGKTYNLPRAVLPVTAKEGDVISLEAKVEKEDTAERRNKINKLMDELFEN